MASSITLLLTSFCRICLSAKEDNTCKDCLIFFQNIVETQAWKHLICCLHGATELHTFMTDCDDCRYKLLRFKWNAVSISRLQKTIEEKFEYYGVEGIDITNVGISEYEAYFLNHLEKSYIEAREQANRSLTLPDNRQSNHVMIANFSKRAIYHIIYFLKRFPDYLSLDPNDKAELLKQSMTGLYIFSMHDLFDFNNNVYIDCDGISVNIVQFKDFWSERTYEETIEFLKSLKEHQLSTKTTCLCILLYLFDVSFKLKLNYNTRIRRIHKALTHLIWKHLISNSTSSPYQVLMRLQNKLNSLSNLQEYHEYMIIEYDQVNILIN